MLELLVPERIARFARQAPDADAVVEGERVLSYGALDAWAERLAARLRLAGAGPEVRVGIHAPRGIEMVVAVVAVWKAGAAYVPLDPAYPPGRLEFMVADAGVKILLSHAAPLLRSDAARHLEIGIEDDPGTSPPSAAPIERHPDLLAYVIYTSGSTGVPKGVAVTHRTLLNLVSWHEGAYGMSCRDRTAQVASFSFDASVWELTSALGTGGALCIVSDDARKSMTTLIRWLERYRVTIAFLPTAMAEALLQRSWSAPPEFRALLTGGDRLRRSNWATPPFRLINHYGPTEATVVTTCAEVRAESAEEPPIGRAITNLRADVLDEALRPMPVGAAGELFVGGAGVARGYLGRPELTAERFLPDPSSNNPGARLYRTGDRALQRSDGELVFLGRADAQVKVRGFRIELGEVESVLRSHPDLSDAVVVVREEVAGAGRLCAYLVARDKEPTMAALREHALSRLPSYMFPTIITFLEAMPLTVNGKVDRTALAGHTAAKRT